MARPLRSQVIRPDEVAHYHLWSRCVRKLRLTEDPKRKDFMLAWLRQLHEIFAVEVCRYALMGNHFHLVVRINPTMAKSWSDREVVRRWAALHPPRAWGTRRVEGEALEHWIASKAADPDFVAQTRERLLSIPQFMKAFKQHVAQNFNLVDKAVGAFWQGRYGCAALDSESKLLAAMVYVDLNPHAAGVGELPEEDPHTSLHAGMASRAQAQVGAGEAAVPVDAPARSLTGKQLERATGAQRQRVVPQAEVHAWVVPVSRASLHARSGMFEGVRFEDYVRLVDFTARQVRQGKRRLEDAVACILHRQDEAAWIRG